MRPRGACVAIVLFGVADAIDRATGKASVIEAMQDPRVLPLRYDEALLQVGVLLDRYGVSSSPAIAFNLS